MKLKLTNGDQHRAVLSIDNDTEMMVVVRCQGAVPIAKEIVRAVNRDYLFSALLAALKPFQSDEMGNLLLASLRDPDAHKRVRRLITAIDGLLNQTEKAMRDG